MLLLVDVIANIGTNKYNTYTTGNTCLMRELPKKANSMTQTCEPDFQSASYRREARWWSLAAPSSWAQRRSHKIEFAAQSEYMVVLLKLPLFFF